MKDSLSLNKYFFILFLFGFAVYSQNPNHFIALDKTGQLYDVNPTTCTYTSLSICNNITASGATPLSIAISGTTLYIVDSKGKLWSEPYNTGGNCTLIGGFSLTSGYYGLTVGPNGVVYAATGSKLETYNPTTNTFAVIGTLPTQWKIGGDLLFYEGQLYMACKNLDLIRVNLGNLAASTVQLTFPTGSLVFGFASVSVPCANNQAYAISNFNATTTHLLPLNILTGVVSPFSCSLPFNVYDTASLSENGSYIPPAAPTLTITQPSCSSNTATITVNPIVAGYHYSIDGVTFPNTTGVFAGIAAGSNYSIKAQDTSGCISIATTGTISPIPPNVTPTFTAVGPYCSGSTIAALPLTSNNSITGTWSPSSVSNTATTTYNFTPNPNQCGLPTTLQITINPLPPKPTVTSPQTIICPATITNLTTAVTSAPVGVFIFRNSPSGTLVANPSAVGVGTYTVEDYVAATGCTSLLSSIVVNSTACGCLNPPLLALSSPNGTTCVSSPFTLTNNTFFGSATAITITHTGTGTLTSTSTSVSPFSFTYIPSVADSGSVVTITVTTNNPLGSPCSVTTSTFDLTVTALTIPIFTQIAPICVGGNLGTSGGFPTTSNNNITGVWSPAFNNLITTTYTFTPNAGQCAATAPMTVTITPPNITPTFTQISPVCIGGNLGTTGSFPTISNNSITGVWSPAFNNLVTTIYTFTPTFGQCATTATMTVVITPPNITPTFTQISPLCIGGNLGTSGGFPTTSNNGITGGWSPSFNNLVTTIYTFTPSFGQCANTATMTVVITPPNITPTFTQISPICTGGSLGTAGSLPTTSNNNITGAWSPAFNNTTTTTYTFTPNFGQCATMATMTIVINPKITPTFTQVNPVCSGTTLSALPSTSTNNYTGSWSPAINNTAATTYTFTPTVGECATTASMTVFVNPIPTILTPPTLFECSNGSVTTATFNLTINEGVVMGGVTGLVVSYYNTLIAAQNGISPITTPSSYTGFDTEVVYIRVVNIATGCYATTTQLLRVTQGPVAITPLPLHYCDPNNDGFGVFDLDSTISEITGSPFPIPGVSVTFHETPTDALTGANPLPSPYTNIHVDTQTIYVRVFYTLTGCANYVELQLIVYPTPVLQPTKDLELCDYTGLVGYESFNLTNEIPFVLGNLNPSLYTVTFYTSQSAAELGTGNITSATGYTNTVQWDQPIYVRVTTIATGCYTVANFHIIVHPLPVATQPNYPQYSLCDTTGAIGYETFNLATQVSPILLGQTGMDVTFYPSLSNAQNGTNVITNLQYTNVPIYVQTLGIRVTNHLTGCYVISTMDIRVNPLPSLIPPSHAFTLCDANQDGFTSFDLTTLLSDLLNGITSYTVSFHETILDAQINGTTIPDPTNYININPFVQILYVRAEDNLTGCFSILPIELNVDPSPIAPVNVSIPAICDNDNNPQNGITGVNLTQATAGILAQQPLAPANYTVSYYTTQALAQAGTAPIIPAMNYVGNNGQTIWVRVENKISKCFNISSFQLEINKPLLLSTPTPLSLCDDDLTPNNQFHSFDLTVKNAQITQGTSATVSYYPSLANAQNNSNVISTPTGYTNIIAAVQTLGVVVTTPAGCKSITTLDIRVLPIPTPKTNPPALAPKCDDNNPGDMMEVFNLTVNEGYIGNGDPNLTFHYFASQGDASVPQNEILTPTAALVGTNVWIRVENNRVDYQGNHCYVLVEQPLRVNPLPTVVQPLSPFRVCDDNADGLAVFDLTNPLLAPAILGLTQLPADFTISYYLTAVGANPLTNTGETPLPNSYTNVTPNTQTIYVRVVNKVTGCVNTGVLPLAVEPYARATGPQVYNQCDGYADPYDGVALIDLTTYAPAILNGQDPAVFLVSYYTSLAAAQAGTGALTLAQAQAYQTDPDADTIWVKVENSSNSITPFCNAITTINISVERYPNPIISTANNVTTICADFNTNEVVRTLTLDSGIGIPGNYTFEWFEASSPTTVLGTGSTYTVNTSATAGATRDYTVHVISNSPLGCATTSAPFSVIQSGQAVIPTGTIGYTVTNAFTSSQIITVIIDGYGAPDYEYSLDDGPRQTSNIFENVSLGTHVIHIWDSKGGVAYSCEELVINDVQIIDYPHYFTPNGDGIHDTWNIVGLGGQPNAKIYIFDRYGKLLKQISSTGQGWDGTYNGLLLSSDDYWFTVDYLEQAEAKQFKAHFSLKR